MNINVALSFAYAMSPKSSYPDIDRIKSMAEADPALAFTHLNTIVTDLIMSAAEGKPVRAIELAAVSYIWGVVGAVSSDHPWMAQAAQIVKNKYEEKSRAYETLDQARKIFGEFKDDGNG